MHYCHFNLRLTDGVPSSYLPGMTSLILRDEREATDAILMAGLTEGNPHVTLLLTWH